MNLNTVLQNIGLTEKESQVYLTLLQLHEALPSTIARKAEVKRPTTYVVLEQLQKKGLVSHLKRGNILYYRALDPRHLIEEQQLKQSALEKALPELMQLNQLYQATPQMSVFEGEKGMIQIMEDTLSAETDILGWANVELAVKSMMNYYPTYIKRKNRGSGIWVRAVFNYGEMALRFKKFQKAEKRECYIIAAKDFPFQNEINIYNDKIMIVSHPDQVGVIIQNQHIADTQRAVFKMCFEYAKILEKDLLTEKDYEYLNSPLSTDLLREALKE
jgi:HTH-type transcriptional regulator, sugar sensing transcriptional regulator